MHIFLNGLAATAGGGLTYLRNVVPRLAASRNIQATLLVTPLLQKEFAGLPHLGFAPWSKTSGTALRFLQEQNQVPRLVRESGADLLLSTGNFAVRSSPVPQILLSRNSLYTSDYFSTDLRRRDQYSHWLRLKVESHLAKRSIHWATCTVAPSMAFAEELSRWTRRTVLGLHHGFDARSFCCDPSPLPPELQQKLVCPPGTLRILFVSHYNYYRNFETLLRAIQSLKMRFDGRPVRLFLTCSLVSSENPGEYRCEEAARLVTRLGIANEVIELGAVPYRSLHHVYAGTDVYATAAYAESFAHPLVEAMASGLPVAASDLPVHREICQNSAVYFPAHSAAEMAERILEIGNDPVLAKQLSTAGFARAAAFSWDRHVEELLALARRLTSKQAAAPTVTALVGSSSAA
jgi:glycosyltransferase involved in cell wall biosynthesis